MVSTRLARRAFLGTGLALVSGAAALAAGPRQTPGGAPRRGGAVANPAFRLLAFTRTLGYRHDSIPDALAALQGLGGEHGFAVDATEDPTPFSDAGLAPYAAVLFLLTTGEVLDPGQQAAFERFIREGRGYVGVHSASDTAYGWPWYGRLVGAYFAEHPPIQSAIVRPEAAWSQDLPPAWPRTDEWYSFRQNPRGTVQVLARVDEATYEGGNMGADHPVAWLHDYDGGRAWYTAMGHTSESYAEPLFLQHLLSGLWFAAGAPVPALAGATLLFGGSEIDRAAWRAADGGEAPWSVVDGALEVAPGSGDIHSVATFGDARLHVEFAVPPSPPDAPEQERGNSGVYLQSRYEIQVLDAFGQALSGQDGGGAIYGLKDADVNASRPPGTWQTYDVLFRAARFDAAGTKVANARLTLRWNGALVHDDVEIPAPTPGGDAEGPESGPLRLQDHGHRVRFRAIWAAPLPSVD